MSRRYPLGMRWREWFMLLLILGFAALVLYLVWST